MKGKYYFFELDDCSLPGIASGTLKYLGTKTDFKKLLQGAGPEMKGIRNTFKEFCAGDQTIKHNVAYSEQRFATPVKVLKRKSQKDQVFIITLTFGVFLMMLLRTRQS